MDDHRLRVKESNQNNLRRQWGIRLLGAAHLALATSWFVTDSKGIAGSGMFHEVASPLSNPLQISFLGLWLIGAIGLIAAKLERTMLLLAGVSSTVVLSQLSIDLLQTQDRMLVALSLLCICMPKGSASRHITRLGFGGLFALWAWPSLMGALDHPKHLWTLGSAISYWGWTDAAPTPLAKVLASSPQWVRGLVTSVTLACLAWGPVLTLLKIRLWPVLWLVVTPLALKLGGGIQSWSSTGLWLFGALLLDERVTLSPLQKWSTSAIARRLSPYAAVKWPLVIVGGWLTLSVNSGIAPLIAVALYLLWSSADWRASTDQNDPSEDETSGQHHRSSMIGVLLMTMTLLFLASGHLIGAKSISQRLQRFTPLLLTTADAAWTQMDTSRLNLILERSEDGGASWIHEPHPPIERLTLDKQPWAPLTPLRETRWFHQMLTHRPCEEGPLMTLFESRLRDHIKRLNQPPLLTPHQHILIRARRVEWVRSRYRFWREEGRGFYCIPTNLVVLLKARQLIKQARNTLPQMPKLAPEPKQILERSQKRSSEQVQRQGQPKAQ